MKSFSDRHIVILGATKGIGESLVFDLLSRGVKKLTLIARNQDKLESLQSKARKEFSSEVDYLAGDLTEENFLQKLVHFLEDQSDEFPRDWVFAAGGDSSGTIHRTPFESMDWVQCQHQVQLNYLMPMRLTHLILRELLRPGSDSHLVYLSSQAGFHERPGLASYASSKWGLNGFVKSLFQELRESGIKMTLVAPGMVDTSLIPQSPLVTREEMIRPQDVSESIVQLLSLSKTCCPLELHLYPQKKPTKDY